MPLRASKRPVVTPEREVARSNRAEPIQQGEAPLGDDLPAGLLAPTEASVRVSLAVTNGGGGNTPWGRRERAPSGLLGAGAGPLCPVYLWRPSRSVMHLSS